MKHFIEEQFSEELFLGGNSSRRELFLVQNYHKLKFEDTFSFSDLFRTLISL